MGRESLIGFPLPIALLHHSTSAVCFDERLPFHQRFHHFLFPEPFNSDGVRSVLLLRLWRSALLRAVSSTIEPRISTPGDTNALAATTACSTIAPRPMRLSPHRIDSCTTASEAISQFSPMT